MLRRKAKIFCFISFITTAVFVASCVYAFCVYNKIDVKVKVKQVRGGKLLKDFRAILDPGQHACCNWKNKDCNTGGKKDSIVKFTVYYYDPAGLEVEGKICENYPIKAGGWLEIKRFGTTKIYFCEGHY